MHGCIRCGKTFDPDTAEGWRILMNEARPPKAEHTCPDCLFRFGGTANYSASAEKTTVLVPVPEPDVLRLPPLDEYVAAGYRAENYEQFIENEKAVAARRAGRAEVAPLPLKAPVQIVAECVAAEALHAENAARRAAHEAVEQGVQKQKTTKKAKK